MNGHPYCRIGPLVSIPEVVSDYRSHHGIDLPEGPFAASICCRNDCEIPFRSNPDKGMPRVVGSSMVKASPFVAALAPLRPWSIDDHPTEGIFITSGTDPPSFVEATIGLRFEEQTILPSGPLEVFDDEFCPITQ